MSRCVCNRFLHLSLYLISYIGDIAFFVGEKRRLRHRDNLKRDRLTLINIEITFKCAINADVQKFDLHV